MSGGKKKGSGGAGGAGGAGSGREGSKGNNPSFKFDFNPSGSQSGSRAAPSFASSDVQSALVPLMQKKLGTLIGKDSGYLESLPKSVQNRIAVLKHLHKNKTDLDAEFKKELQALEAKYRSLFEPLYAKRTGIVGGAVEPSATEIEEAKKIIAEKEAAAEKQEGGKKETDNKEEPAKKEQEKKDEKDDVKGIPEFWLTALKHSDFGDLITERDDEPLKFLRDIQCKPVDGEPASFTLQFLFEANPFFEETTVNKTYHLLEKEGGSVIFDTFDATQITWKPGKNVTVKKVTKQQGGGGGKRGKGGRGGRNQGPARTITVEEPCQSFFNFFQTDGLDELDEEERDAQLEEDYEMGMTLKEDLIPNAVIWFTGEVEEGLDDDEDDDEYGEEDDEEEDGHDEEDDEEDEEGGEDRDYVPPKKGADDAKQQDCKQQ